MRQHLLRKLVVLLALLLTASSLIALPSASAQGPTRDFGSEAGFLASLNQQRAAGGLGPLALNGSMTAAADGWALAMANGSFLAHAGDIISGTPGGWSKVGENVGRGQSVTSLTTAFMSSPGHRANVMDATYTHVGIAVYIHPTDGRIYTTHRFAALPGAAPAAAPVVAAPVAAAPVAAPTTPPAPPVVPTVPPAPVATVAPATPIPVVPTPIPTPEPTTPPVPPTPEPTAVPATPAPTETPASPAPTPAAAEAVPEAQSSEVRAPDANFGTPPEQLAFIDGGSADDAVAAKLASKLAKVSR